MACALFWFHPLAWRLRRALMAEAEHACDAAAIENVDAAQYARILLKISNSVRQRGRRVAWESLGVLGGGLLEKRIDSIVRGERRERTSTMRKAIIAVSCAGLILISAACQDRPELPVLSLAEVRAQEQQALERIQAQTARLRDQTEKQRAQSPAFTGVHNSSEADALESELKQNPDLVEAREKLIAFYDRRADKKLARRNHVLWLIEHAPDLPLLGWSIAQISPDPSSEFGDPEGYRKARELWLVQTRRTNANAPALANAASFFATADKPLAEQLLLRAATIEPAGEWRAHLGRLYGMALLGVTDARRLGPISQDRPQSFLIILAVSDSEAQNAFAQHVRKTIARSHDATLLNGVGQVLLLQPKRAGELAYTYLERAAELDPNIVEARIQLAKMRIRQPTPETRAVLIQVDKENKYRAVQNLPDSERFIVLRQQAEYARSEAESMRVLDRDGARAAFNRSRMYAQDLVALAPKFRSDPGYSAAVFTGNVLLAYLAARNGDIDAAAEYLGAAGNVPPSEELAYSPPIVPYDQVCIMLAGRGRRDVAIAFLEHFAAVNVTSRDRLLAFAARLRRGEL